MAKRKRSFQPRVRSPRRPGNKDNQAVFSVIEGGSYWIVGRHSVAAALGNANRTCLRLVTAERTRFDPAVNSPHRSLQTVTASVTDFRAAFGSDIAHQNLALAVMPLVQPDLAPLLASPDEVSGSAPRLILVLDQITDPRNVGAILRSAAAFDALAVIAPARHAAPEGPALAKAASGALDRVPYVQVSNLARALQQLAEAGFWRLGLEADGAHCLGDAHGGGDCALVLGAEGRGLRRLTREACDELARLSISNAVDSLNVSAAAAVALYALRQKQREMTPMTLGRTRDLA